MRFLNTLLLFISCTAIGSAQSIQITEIMADPSPIVGLPDAEYVELYNPTSAPVNLSGWVLFDGASRTLPDKIIPPLGYLIVCAHADTAMLAMMGSVAGISSLSLTNTGDKVSIRNPQGIATDSITYSDTWYVDPDKTDGGWSLEKLDLQLDCLLPSNWKASIHPLGGTPGSINSINGSYVDYEPPLLLHAYGLDSVRLVLVFNEPVDINGLLDPNSISLSPPYSTITASVANEEGTRIELIIEPSIPSGFVGLIHLNHVSDCSGNAITETQQTYFGIKDTFVEGLVINEILFDPKAGGYDFVELYNNASGIVSVMDLSLASISLSTGLPSDAYAITSEERFLYPGQLLVITENPVAINNQYVSSFPFAFEATADLPSMNVDEGKIALMYQDSLVDLVYYREDFHTELLQDRKGVSLERVHPDRKSLEPTTWHSASFNSGGATPGLKNSQYATDLQGLHRLHVEPEIFSPDLDGYQDFITFRFADGSQGVISNITIYNRDGQAVFSNRRNTLLATEDHFSWDGVDQNGEVAPPGVYVAWIELFSILGETGYEKAAFVLAQKLGPR